jgi:type II secretory pathway component PulJ
MIEVLVAVVLCAVLLLVTWAVIAIERRLLG